MKITILCVGKVKEKFYRDGIAEFVKRLSRYCKLEIVEVADEKTTEDASETEIRIVKEKEGETGRVRHYILPHMLSVMMRFSLTHYLRHQNHDCP